MFYYIKDEIFCFYLRLFVKKDFWGGFNCFIIATITVYWIFN